MSLLASLSSLRPIFAKVAQDVFEDWDEWPYGCCDEISRALASIIEYSLPDAYTLEGAQEGDDHSWLVVYTDTEACGLDIPPYYYERGGGYNWQPIKDAQITANSISIWKMGYADVQNHYLSQ